MDGYSEQDTRITLFDTSRKALLRIRGVLLAQKASVASRRSSQQGRSQSRNRVPQCANKPKSYSWMVLQEHDYLLGDRVGKSLIIDVIVKGNHGHVPWHYLSQMFRKNRRQ